jgi:hypothetical protein
MPKSRALSRVRNNYSKPPINRWKDGAMGISPISPI